MREVHQTTDRPATPCTRFSWCDARLHDEIPENHTHTHSEYFLHKTIELAVEVFESEPRAHLYLQFDHIASDGDPMYTSRDHVLHDHREANLMATEMRRLADAIDAAEREMEQLNLELAGPALASANSPDSDVA